MRKILSFLTAILFAGSMMATDVAVTIHASSGDYYAKTQGWVSGSNSGPAYDQVVLDEVITANRIGTGNNGKYYSDWRFYTDGSDAGSFSIDAAEGYELQSVTFTYTTSNSGALYCGEDKLTSKTAYAVSGQKAVFQCKNTNTSTNGQVRLTAIAVTYQAAAAPSATVKTIYCKCEQSWWNADGAAVGVHYWGGATSTNWPGVRMDSVKGEAGLWKYDVPTDITGIMFVRVNGSGDVADWGAKTANLTLPTDENDLYTITSTSAVWGDPGVTGEWSVYGAEPTPVDPPTPEKKLPVVVLAGTMNGWSTTANLMTPAADSLTASVTVALEAGKDTFKIVSDDKWLSLNGEGETLYGFHRDWTTASHINGVDVRNFELTADVAGDYTFTWTYADSTLAITFPAKEEPAKETLNAFPAGKTDFTTYAWGEDVAKNKVIFDDNNYIMMYSQGNPLVINANYGLQIGNSSKVSAFVFRVGETTDITVDLARNGSDVAVTLYYMGATVDTLTSANLTTAGVECAVATISEEAPAAQLVKKDAAAGYYKVVSTLRFCVPAITLGKAPADPTVAVKGSFNEWGDEFPFTLAADKKSASLTANIKKGDYAFKMIINGEWRSNGYEYHREFTGASGITGDNVNNMVFKADVDGDYTFTWTFANDSLGIVYPEKPIEPTAKFYVTGNDALVGQDKAWNPAAIASMNDTLVLNLEANVDYLLKVDLNGTWEGENNVKGYNELTEKTAGLKDVSNDHNIGFKLNTAGEVKVVYIAAANEQPEVFKLIGDFSTDVPPVVETTYYLVGTMTEWAVVKEAQYTFAATEVEGEYMLAATLTEGQGIKVVGVTGTAEQWYPEGMGNEYVVDANHAGNTTIYFRPAGNTEWAAFGGFIYVVPTGTVGIDNVNADAKAVKVIRDGQLLIIKGEKTFNTQGQLVK